MCALWVSLYSDSAVDSPVREISEQCWQDLGEVPVH